ncbi:MAG: hypothetical protein HY318_02240, partial [Armatimonadetes bacterium]|nr:hypothetical protein [Armatimonadota bacterium]
MPPSLLECRYSQDRRAFKLSGKATGSQLAWQPAVEVDGRLWDLDAAEDVRVEEGGASGVLLAGATATIAVAFNSLGLAWELRAELAEEGRTVTFGTVLRNLGKTTRRLGKCSLVRVTHDSGSIALGAESCELVYLNFSGDQGLHQVRRLKAEEGPQKVKHIAHLHDLKSGHTLHLGFTTFDRITTSHTFACGADGSLVALDSYCDFFGYELRPGESIATETLVLEMSTNPYVSLERWADRVNEHYQPSLPSRCPASWVGWSWVDGFNVEKYESVVLRNARAMRERLAGFELDYIWVSIGNIEGGLPGNWLKFNADLFPGGVVNLVSRLRELDLKLGFWVAPFWICSHATDTVEELRECLLRDEAGNLLVTCSEWAYGDGAALPKGERPVCYSLDGSHPKAVEFLRKVFGTYRDWGVRYYMIDFLHAGLGVPSDPPYGDHHDPTMVKGPEVYRHALQAVRDAAGSDTYLLCSSGPTVLNTGLVDAARVGNDYGEGRALYPDTYFYPATFVINGPGFWTSHKYATTNMAGTYFT